MYSTHKYESHLLKCWLVVSGTCLVCRIWHMYTVFYQCFIYLISVESHLISSEELQMTLWFPDHFLPFNRPIKDSSVLISLTNTSLHFPTLTVVSNLPVCISIIYVCPSVDLLPSSTYLFSHSPLYFPRSYFSLPTFINLLSSFLHAFLHHFPCLSLSPSIPFFIHLFIRVSSSHYLLLLSPPSICISLLFILETPQSNAVCRNFLFTNDVMWVKKKIHLA